MFMFEPEGLGDKIFNKQESVFTLSSVTPAGTKTQVTLQTSCSSLTDARTLWRHSFMCILSEKKKSPLKMRLTVRGLSPWLKDLPPSRLKPSPTEVLWSSTVTAPSGLTSTAERHPTPRRTEVRYKPKTGCCCWPLDFSWLQEPHHSRAVCKVNVCI